jgi:outer membrane protein assembly factor BamB
MSKIHHLALFVLVGLVGCASNGGGGGDDVVGDDDDAPPFTNGVSTLSGAADAGYVDGPRGTARFANPVNVAYGPDGMVYVADFDNNKIRAVDAETGQTTTLIAQDGFKRPFAMAFAPDGILYVSTDNDNVGGHTLMSGTIWRVDIDARTATVVVAKIGRPRGLAVLDDGRVAVSDYMHHVVQILDPRNGQLTPLAGTWDVKGMVDGAGGAAKFSTPYGIAATAGGLLVADFDNNRLRLVGLDGVVQTLSGASTAGFVDGSMSSARFNKPQALALASNGDVYLTDLGNFRVRRIHGDNVDTVAGNGEAGYVDSDDRLASQLFGMEGMSLVPDGSMLFIADGTRGEDAPYNRIRSVKMN